MNIPSPGASMKNINYLIALFILLWLACPAASLAQPPATPAASGNIIVSGKLACALKRAVIMPFFGVMRAVPVQAGQQVRSGEVLARYRLLPEAVAKIRSRLFPREITDLEMTQAKLTARLKELEKQRAGLRQLAQHQLTSQQSLDQVENEIRLTAKEKAAVVEKLGWARQLHQDDLALLRKQLGTAGNISSLPAEVKLTAPLDGHVVWMHPDMRVGAEFKPEEHLFLLGTLDTMVIKAQVHELEAMRLKLGDPAELEVVALPGQTFPAQVSRISWSSLTAAVDQPSFYEVEFTAPNPGHILKDGLKVRLVVTKAPNS